MPGQRPSLETFAAIHLLIFPSQYKSEHLVRVAALMVAHEVAVPEQRVLVCRRDNQDYDRGDDNQDEQSQDCYV
jgi:hypothetical protein